MIDLIEVDSTNSEAKRLLAAGHPPGFAVSAERQTAGRGRLRRAWQSLPGNMSLTLVVPWQTGRADGPTIALATGLAIRRTLARIVGARGIVAIKWPNDVLIDGAKVSGTLIEAHHSALCVGIGINVARRPDIAGYPTTHLSHFANLDKNSLVAELIAEWRIIHTAWVARGFSDLIAEYNESLYLLNQEMRLSVDREKALWISGLCRGVDECGRLILEDPNGMRSVHLVGEVDAPTSRSADV